MILNALRIRVSLLTSFHIVDAPYSRSDFAYVINRACVLYYHNFLNKLVVYEKKY